MDRINKIFARIILISILISIFSCYGIYKINIAKSNIKFLIQLDMNMYLLSLDCEVSEFEIVNGEIIYSVKKGRNTDTIITYLKTEGYDMSIYEKNNKAQQLIKFQKLYKKNKLKGIGNAANIRDKIREDMTKAGYQWEYTD